MSWFGGGLSNLQGKITSLTAQVLNDVTESLQGKISWMMAGRVIMTRHQMCKFLFHVTCHVGLRKKFSL